MAKNSIKHDDRSDYVETFDNGHGGWLDAGPVPGRYILPEIRDGVVYCRSPWRVDANHAPPGAGYLYVLIFLHTKYRYADLQDLERPNRFVEEGKSRDFTNAKITVRLRGEVDLQGAELLLHVQADVLHPKICTNFVLTGQPFQITRDWSEQTVKLVPDPDQWLCLGSRHDLTHAYGCGDIAEVLRDVNVDLIFVLFPLKIVPVGKVDNPHILRVGKDYEVDARCLPKGEIQIDTVKIEYAPR